MNSMDFSDVLTLVGLLLIAGSHMIGVMVWGGRKADSVREEARIMIEKLREDFSSDTKELHGRVNEAMRASIPRLDMERYMDDLKKGIEMVNVRLNDLTSAVLTGRPGGKP